MLIVKEYVPIILSFVFLNFNICFSENIERPKVAVIGAGIGGASASYFLTELFNKDIDIDVFESKKVGGRLATINVGNEEFEAGGSVIHPRNKYMKYFVKTLNLDVRPPSDSTFGIWNGKEFVMKESSWEAVTVLKLLYRYGLEPFHLHRYVNSVLTDFEKIYDLQENGIAFENVTGLIGAMNKEFVDLLQISIKDHLTKLGYGPKLINELVEATIVVNYGQDTNVHAFVAAVSIAGAGFDLWSVKHGNKEVPKHLFFTNDKVSLKYSTVNKIQRHSTENLPKYEIFYESEEDGHLNNNFYDIVIIAAPLTNDQEFPIIFEGFNNKDLISDGEYQTTIATFVSGNVNFKYFGLDEEIGGIMSCDPVVTKISSIGQLSTVEGTKSNQTNKVWKIFSRKKLDNSIIDQMFTNVEEIKEIKWKAYPQYSSDSKFDKFKLDDSMYYVNAIEWAASAMEMSAISGRNAAILAFNDYTEKYNAKSKKEQSIQEEITTHSPEL